MTGSPATGASHEVVLYTRIGCGLCDVAAEVLRKHGLHPKMVDIDADAKLRERYDHCVPVVLIDGRERFRGRVNEVLLRRLLRAGPALTLEPESESNRRGGGQCRE